MGRQQLHSRLEGDDGWKTRRRSEIRIGARGHATRMRFVNEAQREGALHTTRTARYNTGRGKKVDKLLI